MTYIHRYIISSTASTVTELLSLFVRHAHVYRAPKQSASTFAVLFTVGQQQNYSLVEREGDPFQNGQVKNHEGGSCTDWPRTFGGWIFLTELVSACQAVCMSISVSFSLPL